MKQSHAVQLRSESPAMEIDFDLPPGTFARIGSSPDAEISLPFAGLADISARISRATDGAIHLSTPDGISRVLTPPAIVNLPPYQFLLLEPAGTPVKASGRRRRKSPTIVPYAVAGVGVAFVAGMMLKSAFSKSAPADPTPAVVAKAPVDEKPAAAPAAPVIAPEPTVTPAPAIVSAPPAPQLPPPTAAVPALPQVEQKPSSEIPHAPLSLEDLAEKAEQAVFRVEVMNAGGDTIGTGTAFAISADGDAITNYHVVEKGATFAARSPSGRKLRVKKVVAVNPTADLALISLDTTDQPFLEMGDSMAMKVGAPVAVYGSPDGLNGTLSEGILSAKRSDADLARYQKSTGMRYLQITAPISAGSSGSPVLDRNGKVVGVATSILTGASRQSLNFAVPVESVRKLVADAAAHLPEVDPSVQKSKKSSGAPEYEDDEVFEDPDYLRFNSQMEQGNTDTALDIARRLIKRYPESPIAQVTEAYALSQLGHYRQAEAAYRKSIKLDPTFPHIWGMLGICQAAQEKFSDARDSYKKCLTLDPTLPWVWARLVSAALILDNSGEAIDAMEVLRKLDPTMFQSCLTSLQGLDFTIPSLTRFLEHFGVKGGTQQKFDEAVVTLITDFLLAQELSDPRDELVQYSEVVDSYFEKGRRTRSEIVGDMQSFRKSWPVRSFQFVALESTRKVNDYTVEATYRVKFSVANGSNKRTGEMRQYIRFGGRRGGDWRISAIKTFQN